jgi:hypothetical protein
MRAAKHTEVRMTMIQYLETHQLEATASFLIAEWPECVPCAETLEGLVARAGAHSETWQMSYQVVFTVAL